MNEKLRGYVFQSLKFQDYLVFGTFHILILNLTQFHVYHVGQSIKATFYVYYFFLKNKHIVLTIFDIHGKLDLQKNALIDNISALLQKGKKFTSMQALLKHHLMCRCNFQDKNQINICKSYHN